MSVTWIESRTKRMGDGLRALAVDPLFYVQSITIAILGILIVYPVIIVLGMSVRGADGGFTLQWFGAAYGQERLAGAIVNTFMIATGTAVTSTVMGTLLAWAVVRTDMPGRRIIELAAIIPFVSSPFVGALAWVLLASPATGLINQLWTALGASGPLVNIYSIWGIIFVDSLYEMPFVFLLVAGALRSVDPSLEEASLSSGAGLLRTTFKVTLPLVTPAILAGALLVFVLSAEQFGVPAVLGTPARIRVLTTSIVETQASYPPNYGLGASLSMTLLTIAIAGMWLQQRLLGTRSYATVGGKSRRPRVIELGPLRWLLFAICASYLVLAVVLPYGALILSSLRTNWTMDFDWSQLTLKQYVWILFEYPIAQRAFFNSLLLAVIGASVAMLFCAVISFLSLRTRLPGHRLLKYLSFLPMGFPGVVLAFGLLQAWIYPPFVLYGTIWILFVAYITRYIPIGVQSTSATLVQIHPELEESSQSCGANWFQTFWHVTLPLLKPGLFAGWVLLFVAFTRELSASVLLYSPQLEVISVAIYDLLQDGQYRQLSALAILQLLMVVAVLAIARWAFGLDKLQAN